jgi:hypothetical protein
MFAGGSERRVEKLAFLRLQGNRHQILGLFVNVFFGGGDFRARISRAPRACFRTAESALK